MDNKLRQIIGNNIYNLLCKIKLRSMFFINDLKGFFLGERFYINNGLKFWVRRGTDDINIFNEVAKDYFKNGFEVKKGDVIIDIGAHIGSYSLMASKNAKLVYAFEPFVGSFNIFKKNIKLNNIENIKPYCKGISFEEGKKTLYLSPYSTGAYSIYSNLPSRKYKIDCINLSNFMTLSKINKIDILKLDCEGAEYEILFNLPKETLNKIKRIVMECHNSKLGNDKQMQSFLESNGYKVINELNSVGHHNIYATNDN